MLRIIPSIARTNTVIARRVSQSLFHRKYASELHFLNTADKRVVERTNSGQLALVAKKENEPKQQWEIEPDGIISSVSDPNLVVVIVGPRKGKYLNALQRWEFYDGRWRSKANHSIILHESGGIICPCGPAEVTQRPKWNLSLAQPELPSPAKPYVKEVQKRIDKIWSSTSSLYGIQTTPEKVFSEILNNRYCLVNGYQIVKDEIQLTKDPNLENCKVNWELPSVLTTLAYTNCGDRINQPYYDTYRQLIGSRFSSVSMDSNLMTEFFSPAGGGTESGGILAHVTVDHMADKTLLNKIFSGHGTNYVLANFDLQTHVGCDKQKGKLIYGRARESAAREDRKACGAVIGALDDFDTNNSVHTRLKQDLGENYEPLRTKGVFAGQVDIRYVVAAALVALKGLHTTIDGLVTRDLKPQMAAHLTASVTVNGFQDEVIYLGRATVFNGTRHYYGFGDNAQDYFGEIIGDKLHLKYKGGFVDKSDTYTPQSQ